jgi:hypothetical protein
MSYVSVCFSNYRLTRAMVCCRCGVLADRLFSFSFFFLKREVTGYRFANLFVSGNRVLSWSFGFTAVEFSSW